MSRIEEANAALAALQAKLSEAESRQALLSGERDQIAFAAHTGEARAAKRLTEVSHALVEIDGERKSLEAAIRTAEQKVNEATAAERAEIEATKARSALALRKDMLDAAKIADRSLEQVFAALSALRGTISQLNRLGCGPNVSLAEANIKRCLVNASMGSPFALGHLAPAERHTVTDLVGRWSTLIETFAAERSEEAA